MFIDLKCSVLCRHIAHHKASHPAVSRAKAAPLLTRVAKLSSIATNAMPWFPAGWWGRSARRMRRKSRCTCSPNASTVRSALQTAFMRYTQQSHCERHAQHLARWRAMRDCCTSLRVVVPSQHAAPSARKVLLLTGAARAAGISFMPCTPPHPPLRLHLALHHALHRPQALAQLVSSAHDLRENTNNAVHACSPSCIVNS